MPTLRCERYPSLIISDLGVRFVAGVAQTDDPRVIARARRLAHLGVTVEDDTPAVQPRRTTKKPAPKPDPK